MTTQRDIAVNDKANKAEYLILLGLETVDEGKKTVSRRLAHAVHVVGAPSSPQVWDAVINQRPKLVICRRDVLYQHVLVLQKSLTSYLST